MEFAHGIRRHVAAGEDSGDRADVDNAPLARGDQRREGLRHAIRAVDVHVHEQVELFHARVGDGTDGRDAGVVHEPIQPAIRAGDRGQRRVDVFLFRDVELHGLHVPDLAERVEIRLLASTCVDEVALGREVLGDRSTDAGTRARHQHGLRAIARGGLSMT
jgi:hypothetical protein